MATVNRPNENCNPDDRIAYGFCPSCGYLDEDLAEARDRVGSRPPVTEDPAEDYAGFADWLAEMDVLHQGVPPNCWTRGEEFGR